MSAELWSRLRWSLTLLLLASFLAGVAILTFQRLGAGEPLEIILPAWTPPAGDIAETNGSRLPTATTSLVNINTASTEQLQTLTGIGPVLAQGIIQWREENGPFERVEDLLRVSGIGPKTLDNLRDSVTVR